MHFISLAAVGTPIYFAYFMKGDGPRPADQAKLQEWQKAHIGNLQALFDEGRLLAAGPCNDPSTERRGIMVLVGKPTDEYFSRDPYVQNKIMKVVSWPWTVDTKKFETKLPDPDAISEFVTVEADVSNANTLDRLWRHLVTVSTAIVGGPANGKVFYLVEGPNAAMVQAGLKEAGLPGTAYQQWMARGTIKH